MRSTIPNSPAPQQIAPASVSAAYAIAASFARSTEVRGLSSIVASLARSTEVRGLSSIAASFARSTEVRGLSSIAASFARSTEVRGLSSIAASFARSTEVRGLSSIVASLARSTEVRGLSSIAASFARSTEVRGLSSIAASFARSTEVRGLSSIAASFARSTEVRGLSSIAATVARWAEASRSVAGSVAGARVDDAYRASIASALKTSPDPKIRVRPRGWSTLFDESVVGFTRRSHLSDVVHTEEPYSESVAELIGQPDDFNTAGSSDNADKCDEASVCTGFSLDSMAFPRATYDKVLFSAGFRLSFASVPIPQAIELPDPDAVFNPKHWQILNELEQRLRQVVEQNLEKLAGSNWMRQRIPQTVSERWGKRQEEDRANGRSVHAAIQYADFMDMADVITRRDNWREAFQTIFRDTNDIAVSLRRLHPVRKALAHSRPLGRDDVLTLVGEATRIFRALGIRVLH